MQSPRVGCDDQGLLGPGRGGAALGVEREGEDKGDAGATAAAQQPRGRHSRLFRPKQCCQRFSQRTAG